MSMSLNQQLRSLLAAIAIWLLVCGALAQAQPAQKGYEPKPYQEGKDVIWLPTPQALVDKMLQMARVGPRDFVIDLGSGDSRTVITAAKKFGARAMGIEYNPDMVEYSGRVGGNSMEGSVRSGDSQSKWSATLRSRNPVSSLISQ